MRLVMLTCEQIWQRAFAARLAKDHELDLVVIDQHFSVKSRARRLISMASQPRSFVQKVLDKIAVRSFERRDARTYHNYFDKIGAPAFEQSARKVIIAPEINSPEIAERIKILKPDVIIVSGTRIIKAPVIDCEARFGIINMHTGLSPYYRGGPCTFWTLYNEEPEYAGVTIHYLSPGIDNGDIILSGRPSLDTRDNVASLDLKVIDLGHLLMLRALRLVEEGRAPRTPNWEKGKLFLYKQFTRQVRVELEKKLQDGLMKRCLRRIEEQPPMIRTIDAV